MSWKLGGGGFLSNADDMARYAAALINRELISAKSEGAMWTPQSERSGMRTSKGLGFSVSTESGVLKVWHNGAQEKTRTRLVIYPRERHGMVVLTNSENVDPGKFSTAAYQALKSVAK